MKTTFTSVAGLFCALTLMAAAQGCSGGYEASSQRPTGAIVVDGKADDWQGHLLYYRDAKLTIGICNDNDFLYLCVTSSDQTVYRSVLMRGLTVWFDTTAGKGKYFGMRFPLEPGEAEMPMNQDEQPGSLEDMMKRRADDAAKLAIVGAKKDSRTEILLPGRNGLDARIGYKTGVFVYEMKVPLGREIADGMHLAFSPERLLSVRFETPELETKNAPIRANPQGAMNDGGMNDGGMQGDGESGRGQQRGAGHRPGGMPESNGAQRPQSIDVFMKVQKAP